MDCVWNELNKSPSNQRKNYKFSYDYRILKPDGNAIRILEQNTVLRNDASGEITHLLGTCNDITQWKRNGTQLASLASSINQQYFLFTAENTSSPRQAPPLSKRELEIVKLISEGRSSKYIADKLFISFHTVNTHRQKMIEKTGTKNTGELVQFAARNGLI
jgi:DNA-binding CsgD family transcriptional regulator